jgi:DUF1680 family protein/RimJ/RimL family protein N-acetyltransferase
MNFDWQRVLETNLLILRPLREEDFDNLFNVASDPLIWEQHPAKDRCQRKGFELFFKEAMESKGGFIVIDKKTAEVIGSTRFHPVKESQNAIEIGWTFLARKYWGGAYNGSMKMVMMDHAFKFVDQVLFYIHENNYRSQKAVEKIGGKRIVKLEDQILEPRSNATVIYSVGFAELPVDCNYKIASRRNIRPLLISLFISLILGPSGFTQNPIPSVSPKVTDSIQDIYIPAPFENQKIGGIIGQRMSINLSKRLLQVDQAALISGFLSRPGSQDWVGEHIGKYLETACNTWRFTHNTVLKEQMDSLLHELLGTQLPDGYLGTYSPDKYWTSWDVWVHKYDLVGLIAYYKTFAFQPALSAAKRIGDLLVKTFGNRPGQLDLIASGEHIGMASTSVLDPMIELYRYTGEAKYLDFAKYVIRAYDQQNGPKIIRTLFQRGEVNKVANGKAYEMLSNLVGIIKLYKVTGETRLRQAVEIAWQDIIKNRLYITGTASSFERFQGNDELPAGEGDDMGEGCVTTTWIQLNYQLFALTGDTKYLNQIEKSVYNHLLGAEDPQTGCVSYYTSLMNTKPYSCSITCCLSSVPRGISMIPQFNYGKRSGTPTFLLFESTEIEDSILTITHTPIALSIKALSAFPARGHVAYTVSLSQKAYFPISFRVPEWAAAFMASVDGRKFTGEPDTYLTITRTWKTGDRITLDFDLPVKIIRGGHNYQGFIAFQRGPQILSADSSLNLLKSIWVSAQQLKTGKITLKDERAALPVSWIGHQAYVLNSSINPAIENRLILVPFADASQTGATAQVWIPIKEGSQ